MAAYDLRGRKKKKRVSRSNASVGKIHVYPGLCVTWPEEYRCSCLMLKEPRNYASWPSGRQGNPRGDGRTALRTIP